MREGVAHALRYPPSMIDPATLTETIAAEGWAILPALLPPATCADVRDLWAAPDIFRSEVNMARHGFGRGSYRYFADPLPPVVQGLRTTLYPPLATLANRWAETLGQETRYPDTHAEFAARCHAAGQTRPTPLLLRYGPGDWNALHQDLYGEHVFPLQIAILLSEPDRDFTGGEFVLTEQRPRMQSRAAVVPLEVKPTMADAPMSLARPAAAAATACGAECSSLSVDASMIDR